MVSNKHKYQKTNFSSIVISILILLLIVLLNSQPVGLVANYSKKSIQNSSGRVMAKSVDMTIEGDPGERLGASITVPEKLYGKDLEKAPIYSIQIESIKSALNTIRKHPYDFLKYPKKWEIAPFRVSNDPDLLSLGFVPNYSRGKGKINIATEDIDGNPIDSQTIMHSLIHEMIHSTLPINSSSSNDIKESIEGKKEIVYGTVLQYSKDGKKYESILFEEMTAHLLENDLINGVHSNELTYDLIKNGRYGSESRQFIEILNSKLDGEKIDPDSLAMFMGVASTDTENSIKKFSKLIKSGVKVNGSQYNGYDVNPVEIEKLTIEFIKSHDEYSSSL